MNVFTAVFALNHASLDGRPALSDLHYLSSSLARSGVSIDSFEGRSGSLHRPASLSIPAKPCCLPQRISVAVIFASNLLESGLEMSVVPRAEKSGVWLHFKRLDSNEAECLLCPTTTKNKRVLKTTGRSTGGLHSHLRTYHPLEYSMVVDKKDLAAKRSRQCAAFLAEHASVSPAVFHSQSFLSFFPESEWSTFPSRTTLTDSVIPEMVEEIRQRNKKDLAGVPVTLVSDGWTSKGSKVSLTAVLAYFITKDFKQEGRLIAVKKTVGRHTAEAIKELLDEVIKEMDLTVTAIVSDSAANVRKAVRLMGLRNPRCTNHQLHIMLTRGLAAWKGGASVKKVKEFARSLNTSAIVRDVYFKACEDDNLRPITVPNSVDTRWGSELKMITSALTQITAVNSCLEESGKRKVSDSEVHCLQQTAKILSPFDRFTHELSREGNILSEALFVMQGAKAHLENIINTETGSTRKLAQLVMVDLQKKWPNYFEDDDVLLASLFDPSAVFNFKNDVDWKDVGSHFPDSTTLTTAPAPAPTPSAAMSSRRAAIYGTQSTTPVVAPCAPSCSTKTSGGTTTRSIEAELTLYLDQCTNGVDVNHEALDFWRLNHTKYPRLAVLAREYLSSPPTSVSAERVFSAAGLIYRNHLKNRLSAEHAEDILLLRLNLFGNLRAKSHGAERVIVKTKDFRAEEEVVGEPEEEEEREMDEETEEDEFDANGNKITLNMFGLESSEDES